MSLQSLLHKNQLAKLDQCPFPAKIGPNTETSKGFALCAFFYAANGMDGLSALEHWSLERGFEDISLYTAGCETLNGWTAGTLIREVLKGPKQ